MKKHSFSTFVMILFLAFASLLFLNSCNNASSTSSSGSSETTTTTTTTTTGTTTTTIALDSNDPTITLRSIDPDWIPFADYQVNSSEGYLEIFTDSSRTTSIKCIPCPYRVHSQPFTGHVYGKLCVNWAGFFKVNQSEMTQFGDTYGISKETIDAMVPYYIAPVNNFTINWVELQTPLSGYYGDSKWVVKGHNGYAYVYYDHCRQLHSTFISKMVAAGNSDPTSASPASGVNLVTNSFTLNEGDKVAQPQVLGTDISGHTDYLTGMNGSGYPYCQIEFNYPSVTGREQIYNVYSLMPEATKNSFLLAQYQTWNKAELQNADIFNYFMNNSDATGIEKFWWRAECTMEPTYATLWDNDSVFDGFQSWFEVRNASDTYTVISGYTRGDSLNDDYFTIFQISKDSNSYQAGLYSSSSVAYLVQKANYDDNGQPYIGEVLDSSTVGATSGQMIIHWKIKADAAADTYQAASYSLDTSTHVLKIRWGTESSTSSEVSVVAIPDSSETADGTNLIQYKQDGHYSATTYGLN